MADIELVIKIPEKEFGIDINDKFQDFFNRLKVEIEGHLINNTNLICGAYELETIDMFLKAFNNGTSFPKGYIQKAYVQKVLKEGLEDLYENVLTIIREDYISKAEYEARLKADMVAILENLDLQIDESAAYNLEVAKVQRLIRDKIGKLRGEI